MFILKEEDLQPYLYLQNDNSMDVQKHVTQSHTQKYVSFCS